MNLDHVKFIRTQRIKSLSMMGVFIASLLFMLSSLSKWQTNRSEAIGVPILRDKYPMISFMPNIGQQTSDANLYNFIEDYIHWVYNETLVDFHKPSDLERSNTAYLRANLSNAIDHSLGEAKMLNQQKFKDSQDTFIRLKRGNHGYIFNINAIESVIKTNYSNIFHVTVLGEFQLTGDKKYKNEEVTLWGFKRIWLTVIIRPERKEGFKNGQKIPNTPESLEDYEGYYVTYQDVEDLDYYDKDKILKRINEKGFVLK